MSDAHGHLERATAATRLPLLAALAIAALPVAATASGVGPSATTVETLLPPGEVVCFQGRDKRTPNSSTLCAVLAPHVVAIDCREAAELGGHVCDYSVQYADRDHQIGENHHQLRSDLFARGTENPEEWRLVRAIAPPRTQTR